MALISDSAIALRRLDYSETSQIVVFFTRNHGQVRTIAKGIKRNTKTKFATGIDLLDIGSLVVNANPQRSAGLATVTEWKQTHALGGLREKLERVQAAQYAAEVVSRLTQEWDPHASLFDALFSMLNELSQGVETLRVVAGFQLELLKAIGSLPRFDCCVLCRRSTELTHFSAFEGGMICRNCQARQVEKHAVTAKTWTALRDGDLASPLGPFSLLNYCIAHLMGQEPLMGAKLVPRRRRTRE